MTVHRITDRMIKVCDTVYLLAYLNILWFIFTLLGLVILGIAPSTVAMISILKERLDKNEATKIFSTFFHNYKLAFKKSNQIGIIILVSLLLLSCDIMIVSKLDGMIQYVILTSVIVLFTLISFMLVYIFPLIVWTEMTIVKYLQTALLLAIGFPRQSILALSSCCTILTVSLLIPAIGIFFLGSGMSYLCLIFTAKVFDKVQEQNGLTA